MIEGKKMAGLLQLKGKNAGAGSYRALKETVKHRLNENENFTREYTVSIDRRITVFLAIR